VHTEIQPSKAGRQSGHLRCSIVTWVENSATARGHFFSLHWNMHAIPLGSLKEVEEEEALPKKAVGLRFVRSSKYVLPEQFPYYIT
jgi:hypothetical protein